MDGLREDASEDNKGFVVYGFNVNWPEDKDHSSMEGARIEDSDGANVEAVENVGVAVWL